MSRHVNILVVVAGLKMIVMLLLFESHFGICDETFFVSFQRKYDGYSPPSVDEWIEFKNDSNSAKAITMVPELNANKNFDNVWLCWEQTNLTNRKLCLIKSNCIASSYINAK